jgi:5-methylcytosine-specific restriction endonuclease McrA
LKKKYTKELLDPICQTSYSVLEVMKKLGIQTQSGAVHRWIKKTIYDYDIDITHFKGKAANKGKKLPRRISEENIFSANKRLPTYILRRTLEDYKFEYKCSICGINEWNNVKISLQIDHINGNCRDNRLENLRYLCPNCHSQTDTWGFKKGS